MLDIGLAGILVCLWWQLQNPQIIRLQEGSLPHSCIKNSYQHNRQTSR